MRRFLATAVALVATTAATSLAIPTSAGACTISGTCHGLAHFHPSGVYDGGISAITTNRLTNNATPSDFITSELWAIDSSPSPFAFVEAGAITGYGGSRRWFWAERCPDGSGSLHSTGLAFSLGTTYNAKISYNSGGKYANYRDGAFVANSATCHNSTLVNLETGSETSANNNVSSGTDDGLQKRSASLGTWSYNWGGSTITQEAPETASWIVQYGSLRFSAK
jgi:hypothetical protein